MNDKMVISAIERSCVDSTASLVEPVEYPNDEPLFLVPVECPAGAYEHRIIVPAYYRVTCLKDHKYPYRGSQKVCLTHGFFLSGCAELTLPQHLNIPEKLTRNCLYVRQWTLFNGGEMPHRLTLEYMTPKVFLQKSAIVLVGFAHPKFSNGTKMSEQNRYPVVKYARELCDISLIKE